MREVLADMFVHPQDLRDLTSPAPARENPFDRSNPFGSSIDTSGFTPEEQKKAELIDSPAFETVSAWALAPEKAAELESQELVQSLEHLRDVAVAEGQDLDAVARELNARRKNLAQLEAAALDLEQSVEPDMSGFMKKIRKEFSRFEKNVLRPVGDVAQKIEKYTIRPWSSPIGDALKVVDRAVIRPWSQPLHAGLKKFEKYTVRPAASEVKQGIVFLDQVVPGWSVVLDIIVPIPGVWSIVLNAVRGGSLLANLVSSVIPLPGDDFLSRTIALGDQTIKMAFDLAGPAVLPARMGNYTFTVAKGTATFIGTRGSIMDKLEAVTLEVVAGIQLIVQIATFLVPGAQFATPFLVAALNGLSVMLSGLTTGMTLVEVKRAANELKKQSRVIRDAALAEVERIKAEERALLAQIEAMKAEIERVRRERERLAELDRREASVVAQAADRLGISETTLVLGGLAALGGVVVVAHVLKSGSPED